MVEEFTDEKIEALLLRKLYSHGVWGKHHISESNLPKGFPSHLHKKVLKIAERLRRKSLMVRHPTHHENQWHLNINKSEEIKQIINKFYPL